MTPLLDIVVGRPLRPLKWHYEPTSIAIAPQRRNVSPVRAI